MAARRPGAQKIFYKLTLVAGPPHARSKMTIYAALIGLTIVIVIILAWIILKEVRILQNKIKLSLERQNQTNLALALQNEIIQEVKSEMKVLSFTSRKSESKAAKRNTFQQFIMQGVRRIVNSSRAEIFSLKLRSNRQSKQNLFSTLKYDSLANKLTVVRRELNSLIKDQALVFAAQILSRHLGIDDRQDASGICRSSLKHE